VDTRLPDGTEKVISNRPCGLVIGPERGGKSHTRLIS
jgi:hypothetical protein